MEHGPLAGHERADLAAAFERVLEGPDDLHVRVAHPLPAPLLTDLEQRVDRVARVRAGGWWAAGHAERSSRMSGANSTCRSRRSTPAFGASRTSSPATGPMPTASVPRTTSASRTTGSVTDAGAFPDVAEDEEALSVRLARPADDLVGERQQRALAPMAQGGQRVTEGDEPPVEVEDGARIHVLGGHVPRRRVRHWQPRVAAREAAVLAGIPLHRRALPVAAGAIPARAGQVHRILLADLLAGVDRDRAAQRQEKERGKAHCARTVARGVADLIVVAERIGRVREGRSQGLAALDRQPERGRVPRAVEELEVECERELVVAAVAEEAGQHLGRGVDLTDEDPLRVSVADRAHAADHVVDLGPLDVPEPLVA